MSDFIETLRSIGGVKPCPACSAPYTLSSCPICKSTKLMVVPVPIPNDRSLYTVGCLSCGSRGPTGDWPSEAKIEWDNNAGKMNRKDCSTCNGTGTVLDLAPLLAKPKELEGLVKALVDPFIQIEVLHKSPQYAWVGQENHPFTNRLAPGSTPFKNLHVVGPQRASNLVFKVAEQLGGTAVVAIPEYKIGQGDGYECHGEWHDSPAIVAGGYRLSLTIPDNATILLVTDKLDEQEMNAVYCGAHCGVLDVLPYILCLVGPDHELDKATQWKDGNWVGGLKVIALHQEKA